MIVIYTLRDTKKCRKRSTEWEFSQAKEELQIRKELQLRKEKTICEDTKWRGIDCFRSCKEERGEGNGTSKK
jgi:predicted metal-binding protein